MPTGSRSLLLWPCLAILVLFPFAIDRLLAAEPDRRQAAPASAMGRLDIQGEAIETLTLAKRIGGSDSFDSQNPLQLRHPGSSVSIPVGEYLLQKIELTNGFRCYVPFRIIDGVTGKSKKEPEWLTIRPDKPCLLRVGAPLKLKLGVYRFGNIIHVKHELLDAEGRWYDDSKPSRQLPQFAIYQGDHQIASNDSMSLEYG